MAKRVRVFAKVRLSMEGCGGVVCESCHSAYGGLLRASSLGTVAKKAGLFHIIIRPSSSTKHTDHGPVPCKLTLVYSEGHD